jgi:hypothetical protein
LGVQQVPCTYHQAVMRPSSASHKPMSRAHRLTRGRLGDVGLARGHLLPKAHGLCKVSAPTHPMTTGHRVMGRTYKYKG